MHKTTTFLSARGMPGILWSTDLPFCSPRRLTADERRRVERLQRRLQAQGALCFGAGPGLFLISLGMWLRDPSAESSWEFLAIGVFLGLLILGLMYSPGGWILLREARALKAALQLGIVDRFGYPEGNEPIPEPRPPAPPLREETAREELIRRMELEFGGNAEVVRWFESLRGSGLILGASVPLPKGHHYAPVLAAAEVSECATCATEGAEPFDPADLPGSGKAG